MPDLEAVEKTQFRMAFTEGLTAAHADEAIAALAKVERAYTR